MDCYFLTDSMLKFSTEANIFSQKLRFLIFRQTVLFNDALEKQFWCKMFGYGI